MTVELCFDDLLRLQKENDAGPENERHSFYDWLMEDETVGVDQSRRKMLEDIYPDLPNNPPPSTPSNRGEEVASTQLNSYQENASKEN